MFCELLTKIFPGITIDNKDVYDNIIFLTILIAIHPFGTIMFYLGLYMQNTTKNLCIIGSIEILYRIIFTL